MNITVPTPLLKQSLQTVSVATGGSILPILSHVLIKAESGKVTFSATDLDLFATDSISATVKEPGQATATLATLLNLVGRIQANTITLETEGLDNGAQILRVTGGDVTAALEMLDPEEFPADLEPKGAKQLGCDMSELLEPFRLLSHAISKDAARYTLTGINIAPAKSGTDFCATTGVRLATFHADTKLTDADIIVPEMFVHAILALKREGNATVSVADGAIAVATNGTRISSKLIEGKYVNYKQVIPKAGKQAFSCDRKELINALQTCAIFADKLSPAVKITGRGKQLEIAREDKAKTLLLGTDLSGQPDISIRLHVRYLLDTLAVMSSDEVRIICNDVHSPVLIQEKGFTAVINIMPEA